MPGSGQELTEQEKIYGIDPYLHNGRLYTYRAPFGSEGDQYFAGKDFQAGKISLNGLTYSGILLNFDLLNQEILVKYRHMNGTLSVFCVPKDQVTDLEVAGRKFVLHIKNKDDQQIYQTLGKGKIRILASWWKMIGPSNSYGENHYVFTKPQRQLYLLFGEGVMIPFENLRSFLHSFPPEKRTLIKAFIRKNHYRLRKASDEQLVRIIDYCNSL